jgi:hypothetical protein
MTETWRQRLRRQAQELDAELRAVFASQRDDKTLRDALEALAQKPQFATFTWYWGPRLAQRNRVMFRPFVLSNFAVIALNAKGETFDPWQGDIGAELEAWLQAVDRADDIELTRRLYGWRLQHVSWKERADFWRADVTRRFSAAHSGARRFTALAKVDTNWMSLDAKTALALYQLEPAPAKPFILSHLPYFGWLFGEKPASWQPLLDATRLRDHEFHFELYRRVVEEARWRSDVLELCKSQRDPAALDAELERRHPRQRFNSSAEVFRDLVQVRKRDVVPYIMRHVSSIFPRYAIYRREAKALPDLLAIAEREGWQDLWATLLRTGASTELFDREVKRLVRDTSLPPQAARTRLSLVAGHGREANFPGVSFAHVHPLEEKTALELYRRWPDLMRGPYRMHAAPGWHNAYPELVRAAIDASDTELVDFFAARAGIQSLSYKPGRSWDDTIHSLTEHYEALPDAEFVSRAAHALSRMPAFAVWNYDELLRTNQLARLLFERSTPLYLSDSRAVRDLLESPQIHVQALAFRVLGRDDLRARAFAAEHVDLLQATLFRPLHRRTRLLAFAALENAARNDEPTARYLLGRMRDALALPERRYPTEKLVGLIARVLSAWPALRKPSEVPRIYGEVDA